MSEKTADLHIHSVFSDGTSSPEQLAELAGRAQVSCLAVVDHDTVEAIGPVGECCAVRGIEVIPGIELTAEYRGLEVHILGYLFDPREPGLRRCLEELREFRVQRVHRIVDRLRQMNVALDAQAVFQVAGAGTVSRLHVARAMVARGVAGSVWEAFDKYIGDNAPAHVLGFKLTPAEATRLIRDAGGVAVLAHPYTLRREALIPDLLDQGIQGLEVYYPEHGAEMTARYEQLCRSRGLVMTGGSDFHGAAKPDVKLGCKRIPYELVEALRRCAR